MVSNFELIIILIWIPQAAVQILNWLYWWQVKEYRFDRFITLFRDIDGRIDLRINDLLIKFFLVGSSFAWKPLIYAYVLYALFLDYKVWQGFRVKLLRRPKLTFKAIIVLSVAVLLIGLVMLSSTLLTLNTKLLMLEALLIIGLVFAVDMGNFITRLITFYFKFKARRVLKKAKPKTIGITGSYGKTTTKDFVTHLLSSEYKVAKTGESRNTEIGIAQDIIKHVDQDTEYFVCEMGAYKKGEIKRICKFVKPQIGIITGLEAQHLELFGSIQNIAEAKFELIESLPNGGTALFNCSNMGVLELMNAASKMKKKLDVYGYGMFSNSVRQKYFKSKLISKTRNGTKFSLTDGKERKRIETSIQSEALVENITAAVLLARLSGIGWDLIKKSVNSLKMPEGTLQSRVTENKALIVDDSHNASPSGFMTALDLVRDLNYKKKILITPGIIELGNQRDAIHRIIAERLAALFDQIIITKEHFYKNVIKSASKRKVKLIKDVDQLANVVRNNDKKGNLILLEGRLPSSLIDEIDRIT